MKVYALKVRRDAGTITPVTVPEHEVAILQTLFGEENVQNADGKPVAEAGVGEPVGEVSESEDEFSRLGAKYGGNEDGLIVEQVYGKKAARGLQTAMEAIEGKAAKRGTAKKAETNPA